MQFTSYAVERVKKKTMSYYDSGGSKVVRFLNIFVVNEPLESR